MRQELLPVLPALTRIYGLRPDDLDRMTRREVAAYIDALDD